MGKADTIVWTPWRKAITLLITAIGVGLVVFLFYSLGKDDERRLERLTYEARCHEVIQESGATAYAIKTANAGECTFVLPNGPGNVRTITWTEE